LGDVGRGLAFLRLLEISMGGTPNHPFKNRFSLINFKFHHPFLGTPILGKLHETPHFSIHIIPIVLPRKRPSSFSFRVQSKSLTAIMLTGAEMTATLGTDLGVAKEDDSRFREKCSPDTS
jgi:hypothetical protein